MAYTPILMNKDASWIAIGITWATTLMGFYCSAAGLEGFLRRKLNILERAIFLVAAFLLFSDRLWTIGMGTALMALGIAIQFLYTPAQEGVAYPEVAEKSSSHVSEENAPNPKVGDKSKRD